MSASKEEIVAFMALEFPQTKSMVEAVSDKGSNLSHNIGIDELRPGGTVSGPVTTNLTINFSAEARIIADCALMKSFVVP